MPNLDGLELTRKIRSLKNYKNVPVIIITKINENEFNYNVKRNEFDYEIRKIKVIEYNVKKKRI